MEVYLQSFLLSYIYFILNSTRGEEGEGGFWSGPEVVITG